MREFPVFSLLAALLLPAAPAWAEKGLVEITSEPGGAKVFINGQRKGTTPAQPGKALVLELEEGEYKLEGKTDDGLEAKFDLFVPAGGIQPVNLVFSRPTAQTPPANNTANGGNANSSALIADRYQDNGDGMVTDVKTKLMWMRCSVGQTWDDKASQTWDGKACAGEAKGFSWEDAKKQTAVFAGYSDWRIPSIEELSTLVYCSNGKPEYFKTGADFSSCQGGEGDYYKPTIVQLAFPNTPPSTFWSGSSVAGSPYIAKNVVFLFGGSGQGNRGSNHHVRLVRGGQ